VLKVSADASRITTMWEAPEHQHDLFAPIGLAAAPDGGVVVLERFSAQLWVIDARGKLAWKLGGQGKAQGQLHQAVSLGSFEKDGELVLTVSHRSAQGPALTVLDRFGNLLTQVDGLRAEVLRVDPRGRLLVYDKEARAINVIAGLDSVLAPKADPATVQQYEAWKAAWRARDVKAAEALVPAWDKAQNAPTPMRAGVFRMMAALGFTAAADAQIERVLTESPGRADLLEEAIQHAAETGRLARASQLLEKFDWLLQDAADKDKLSMLLLKLREQALTRPR
jgi:hypothetical protein